MFLTRDGVVTIDFHLDLLAEHLDLLERQLYRLHAEAARSEDPDSDGILDRCEWLAGLAFVACQAYINETYPRLGGARKPEVLRQGPRHTSGAFIADVLDAGANLWKHSGEWRQEGNARLRAACLRVLQPLGIADEQSNGSYPLILILERLADQSVPQLTFLSCALAQWRDAGVARRAETK